MENCRNTHIKIKSCCVLCHGNAKGHTWKWNNNFFLTLCLHDKMKTLKCIHVVRVSLVYVITGVITRYGSIEIAFELNLKANKTSSQLYNVISTDYNTLLK